MVGFSRFREVTALLLYRIVRFRRAGRNDHAGAGTLEVHPQHLRAFHLLMQHRV